MLFVSASERSLTCVGPFRYTPDWDGRIEKYELGLNVLCLADACLGIGERSSQGAGQAAAEKDLSPYNEGAVGLLLLSCRAVAWAQAVLFAIYYD